MTEQLYKKTYIREWRMRSGLSLRRLAARIERKPGEELISFASIGRIERGEQPYSQPILEGIAHALNVPVWALLEVNPEKDGEVVDLVRRMDDTDQRDGAIKALIFKSLAS